MTDNKDIRVELSDEELAACVYHGDNDAMVILLQKYSSLVKYLSRPFYLIGGEPEDLIQEGMIALMEAIWKYDSSRGAAFRSFAQTCIENRLKYVVKSASRKKHSPLNDSVSYYEPMNDENDGSVLLDSIAETGLLPEEQIIGNEQVNELINFARKELTALEREVMGYHILGDSVRAISQRTGRPYKSVENALQRARKKF